MAGNKTAVAKAIQQIHDSSFAPTFYNNEQSLRYYRPTDPIKFQHVDELLKLMAAITHDDRFTEVLQEGGKPRDMCEVLDRVEARGEARGKQEGENKAYTLMQKLISLGRDDDLKRIASDEAFRNELYKEFHLA